MAQQPDTAPEDRGPRPAARVSGDESRMVRDGPFNTRSRSGYRRWAAVYHFATMTLDEAVEEWMEERDGR